MSNQTKKVKKPLRKRIVIFLAHVVLAILAFIWLIPIFWVLLTSFRGTQGSYSSTFFPTVYSLKNYVKLFTDFSVFNFPQMLSNTVIIAVANCLLSTFFVVSVAYTLSRLRFKSRKSLMNAAMIINLFPGFMSMIAIYHFMKLLGLDQSLAALVMVYSGGAALKYYVAKGFFDTIPKSLDEAACIDGATRNDIFFKIILPNSMPIVTYTAIEAFIAPWVDFIFVSVIMKDNYQNYTVALGLYKMLERENIYNYFTQFCAGAVLVALPITLLFIKIQKFYVGGVVGGAVKG